jgi:hypothetical protein
MAADDHMLLLLLGLHFLQLLLHNNNMLFIGWQSPYSSSSGGIAAAGTPAAGCMSLNVAAQLVAVDEFFLAHVALEVLHAEMDGASVNGQAFFPIESLPAVVAHEAGVVFVLPQMALEKYSFKFLKIKDIKKFHRPMDRETDRITDGQTDRQDDKQTDKQDNIKTDTRRNTNIGRHIDRQISKRADRQVGKTATDKTGRRNCNIKMGAFIYKF